MPRHARRRALATAFLLATALVLTGCSALSGHGSGATGPAGPPLSEVTPIANLKTWEGPSTAVAAETPIQPVTDGDQSLPATLIDSQGTEVTVTDTSRILALDLYGSLSRIVFELGLGDNVVGRDISTQFPEAAELPLVTQNGHDLNAEAILEVAPTVILTDTSLGPWDTVLQMRDAGIPVVVVDSHRAIDSVGALTREVGSALGVPQRAEVLAERGDAKIQEKLAEIAAITPADPADRLRMIFLYVRGQSGVYYLFGSESGADSLIEALVTANPDLILMMTKGLESVDGVDGLVEHIPAIAQTTAGQHRRIVDMSDTEILSFGPATAAVLDALAVAIYAPDALP